MNNTYVELTFDEALTLYLDKCRELQVTPDQPSAHLSYCFYGVWTLRNTKGVLAEVFLNRCVHVSGPTSRESERRCFVDNTIHECCERLAGEQLLWDRSIIKTIRHEIERSFGRKRIMGSSDFYRMKTKQFDFGKRWRNEIKPLLDDPEVKHVLNLSLRLFDPDYEEGDPPWTVGRGVLNGQRAREGSLSWYQPWGRCHLIAPFSWALGMKLIPHLQWSILSGELHTVAIGYDESSEEPDWVFDILLFKTLSADESVTFVKSRDWTLHFSLADYYASFFDCEQTRQQIRECEHLNRMCKNTSTTKP
uniref:Uncharacterized protein n=1 Tax=Rubinisphaera brasiliensis (strain ATCC 49424 / DSM 5305 / JCM 21570 / IAM 15109 / NBRC 103401 / IFAM 1448) TaxID=756272 RepID=F0SKS1_RUBBR|nr:hypothetical protein Plabr_1125 [Rubinisphaera brasiliensis DSM 5305]